jgi:hypothetical protein
MTEPTLDDALRQAALERTGRDALPEFGTREWLEFQRDLNAADPELGEQVASAMREDAATPVPPGLERHLRRARNRDNLTALKRNATQKQSPDGRWVPNKNTAVLAVGFVALLGVFVVMTAQRAGAKPTQSGNLLSGAVGIAGRGNVGSSAAGTPGVAAGTPGDPVASAGSARAEGAGAAATIPVQPAAPLFGGRSGTASGAASETSSAAPTARPLPGDPAPRPTTPPPTPASAAQWDATNRPQYGSNLSPTSRSSTPAASRPVSPAVAPGSRTAPQQSAKASGPTVPSSARPKAAAQTSAFAPRTRVASTSTPGSMSAGSPPVRVASAASNPSQGAAQAAPGFAQTASSARPGAVSAPQRADAPGAAVLASGASARTANVEAVTTRPGATVVFRTDSPAGSASGNVAYSRAATQAGEIAASTGAPSAGSAPVSVYQRQPNPEAGAAPAPPVPPPTPSAPSAPPAGVQAPAAPAPPAADPTAALPDTLKPGARIRASLVTTVYAAEGASVPVVAASDEGLWIGRATLGASKRIELVFERLISADGSTFSVTALGFDVNLTQGLACATDLVAPTLATDLLQSGLSGLSTYLGGQFGAGTTTTAPSGATTQTRAAPSLLDSVLGQIGGLFKLPDNTQAIVRVARVDKDTPLVVLYGVGVPPPTPGK